MVHRQGVFVNSPPVLSQMDNNTGSTGVVRTFNYFEFIAEKPEPSYNRLVNANEDR